MSHPVINTDECIGCGICVDSCPQEVLEVPGGVAGVGEAAPQGQEEVSSIRQVIPRCGGRSGQQTKENRQKQDLDFFHFNVSLLNTA